jgi:integrase
MQESIKGVEVKALFDEKRIDAVWEGDRKQFTLNLLAASTGMRMGECQALTVGSVHPDHIAVTQTWERRTGLKEGTKTGAGRIVPLPSKTARYLAELIESSPFQEPGDLVFYGTSGRIPLTAQAILRGFYRALERTGIGGEERKRRRITFHSHRHFLNTLLRTARVPDPLVQRVTGHRTQDMTEHYSHFALEDLGAVAKVQENIFGREGS